MNVRTIITLTLSALVASSVAGVSASTARADSGSRKEVVVRQGDSLSRIAARYKVSMDDLRRWNPTKIGKDDLIKLGDTLVIRSQRHVHRADRPVDPNAKWTGYYDIRPGDTLGSISAKLDVSMEELRRWNGLKKKRAIRAGDLLRYEKKGVRPPAASVGTTTNGRLKNATRLTKGEGYRLRFPKNTFALPSVTETLRYCAEQVTKRFPGTADILIGDLSRPTGGRFPPHQSHQSGRDADVGYYLKKNRQNVTMHRVWPHELDFAKNWTLLRCFLEEDDVVRVYMDEGIQKAFVEYLRKEKAASETLIKRLFEAASGPGKGLVRHAPKHDTHLHVRFACDKDDDGCFEDPGEETFRF